MLRNYLILVYVAIFIAFVVSQAPFSLDSIKNAKTTPSVIVGKTDKRRKTTSAAFINRNGQNNSKNHTNPSKFCNMKNPKKKMQECCKGLPKTFVETFRDDCRKNCVFPNIICCVFNCTLNRAGVLNGNGRINGNLYTRKLKENFKDANWNKIIDDTVGGCLSSATDLVANWTSVMRNHTCRATPERMPVDHCIWRNLLLNCPKKSNDKECQNLFEYAQIHPAYPKEQYCPRKGRRNPNLI